MPLNVILEADFESDIVNFEFEKTLTARAPGKFWICPILNIFASYVHVMMESGQNGPWMYAGIYFASFGTQVNVGSYQVIDLLHLIYRT